MQVITACQKLPRLQFFDPLLKNGLEFRNFLRNGPENKILVDNDLKLNSASLKSRITKKNKPIFVDNSQEEVSKPILLLF